MPHLVAFDVADDQRRYQLVQVLLDYGQRVQESVFWIDVSKELIERMWKRMEPVVEEAEDVVWLVPVCGNCAREVVVRGTTRVPQVAEFYIL